MTMSKIDGTTTGAKAEAIFGGVGAGRVLAEGPVSALPPSTFRTLNEEFRDLAARWREDTEHLSSTSVFTHPAYQRIIGMGRPVVPLLLRDLPQSQSHWFWALRAITGENPVAPADAGNVQKMMNAWLAWGEEHGLV
jgi:hypothetical protein